MKALIVIDIDETHLHKESMELFDRLKGYKCELMPMPYKKEADDNDGWHEIDFKEGWNACIDEILGETE